jgi:hypothetical protein
MTLFGLSQPILYHLELRSKLFAPFQCMHTCPDYARCQFLNPVSELGLSVFMWNDPLSLTSPAASFLSPSLGEEVEAREPNAR